MLAEDDPDSVIGGRRGPGPHRRAAGPAALLAALDRIDYRQLTVRQQLDYFALRSTSWSSSASGCRDRRRGPAGGHVRSVFPATSEPLNRELCELLVFLKSPTVVAKTLVRCARRQPASPRRAGDDAPAPFLLAQFGVRSRRIGTMMDSPPDPQKIAYVFSRCTLKTGWTPAKTHFLLHLVCREQERPDSETYVKLMENIDERLTTRPARPSDGWSPLPV